MIKNRGESLDDRPSFETNNSALELKCTDSAPDVSFFAPNYRNSSPPMLAALRSISPCADVPPTSR